MAMQTRAAVPVARQLGWIRPVPVITKTHSGNGFGVSLVVVRGKEIRRRGDLFLVIHTLYCPDLTLDPPYCGQHYGHEH
jgi:hypothetical protein